MKGKPKEIAGELSDNPRLEAAGTYEKISGIVQEKIGQVKKGLGSGDYMINPMTCRGGCLFIKS